MNCEKCRDTLIEYSLGELPSELAVLVERHLAQPCVDCRGELQEIEEALHGLSITLSPIEPPSRLKEELLSKIRNSRESLIADQGIVTSPAATHLCPRWRMALPYAAAVVVAATLGAMTERHWRLDRVAQIEQLEFDRRIDSSRRLFQPPRMQLAALNSTAGGLTLSAYLVGDPLAGQLHFYAFDLAPPPEGQQLQLWFYTADRRWHRGGSLQVGIDGSCSALFDAPLHGGLERVVITLEAYETAQEPQGQTIFSAKLPRETE